MAGPDTLVTVEKRGGVAVAAPAGQATGTDSIRFRVSNEDVDAYGDIVVQSGLEFPDTLPAVADHSHRLEAALGDWSAVERVGRETFATLRLVPEGKSRLADLVRALHAGGFPLGSSINFDVARADIAPRMAPNGRDIVGSRYLRGKVREITLTQFPANAAAVAVARSCGLTEAEWAALLRPLPAPASIRTLAVARANASRSTLMAIADLISAAQTAHESAQTALDTATAAYEADSTVANLQTMQRATAEAEAVFERLNVLRSAETAAARRAEAAPAPARTPAPAPIVRAVAGTPPAAPALIRRREDGVVVAPGTRLAQLVIVRALAHERRQALDQVATEMFGHVPEVLAIARSAVGVADTTTAGWAAELVRTETRAMLQTDLLPLSVWAQLASKGITLGFNGANTVVIPQMDVGQTADGAWVGEGGAIPVLQGSVGAKRMSRYKIGGIVALTNELERSSDPQAVEVMRVWLRQVLANLLDTSLLGTTAEVIGIKPAGLLFGVAPIAGAAGGGQAAVQKDVQAIQGAMLAANVRGPIAYLMSEMAATRLGMMTNALGQLAFPNGLNGPIIGSPFVGDHDLIGVSVTHFASAFDALETAVNDAATLVTANANATAPTHATGAAGVIGTAGQVPPDGGIPVSGGAGAATVGAVAISMFQTWSQALRMVMPATFGTTKAGSVQHVTNTTW